MKSLIVVLGLLMSLPAVAAKQEIDPTYADGKVVYMIGPHLIVNAAVTNPQLYAQSQELYLLVYPINPTGTATDAKTLPSGYRPQCDPCYHPGLPGPFVYHDHVVSGAPGLGANGTAGEFKGPWKIIVLLYNPAIFNSPDFTPIKSAADIDAAETTGTFLPINPTGANPYEVDTGNVLICPLVSPTA